jgi:hypothetical protein
VASDNPTIDGRIALSTLTKLKTMFARGRADGRGTQYRRPRSCRTFDLERLDSRVLLSLTAYPDSTGILHILGDAANDKAWFQVDNRFVPPWVSHSNHRYVLKQGDGSALYFQDTQRIVFDGGAGNDSFENDTSVPGDMTGGPGADTLIGGTGDDVFHATDDLDEYYGGGVGDILYRNGFHASLSGANNLTVGLCNGSLGPDDMTAQGQLVVSRQGNTLTLNGPSGAGFQLYSNWSQFYFNGADYFYSTSPVSMRTAVGDVTVSPGGYFTVAARTTAVPGVDVYQYTNLSGLQLDTTNAASPLSSVMQKSGFGLKLSPTGLQFGIALGSQIKAMNINLPVNDAVPYLYFSGTNQAQLSLGGWDITRAGQSVTIAGAFDPSDPSLVMRANLDMEGNPVNKFAFGWSTRGLIPFTPKATPDNFTTPLYGNLYTSAQVKTGDYPVDIEGETVIDLDASGNGPFLNLGASGIRRLVQGQATLQSLGSTLANVRVGVNGTGSVGLEKAVGNDPPVKLNVNVSEGTAIFSSQLIAFRVKSADPFAGTPLSGKVTSSSFDIQGGVNPTNRAWSFRAQSSTAGIAGYAFGSVTVAASSAAQRVDVSAYFTPPIGLNALTLNGWLAFKGNFSLTGSATPVDIGTGSTKIHAGASFTLSNTSGVVQFIASMSATVKQDFYVPLGYKNVWLGSVSGNIAATLSLTVSGRGVSVRGLGSLVGKVDLSGNQSRSVSLLADISDNQLLVHLPVVPDLVVKW